MAQRTSRKRRAKAWSDQEIRKHLSGSFVFAKKTEGAYQVDAANWQGVSERTMHTALKKGVSCWWLRSGRLRQHILRYLVACDRKSRRAA